VAILSFICLGILSSIALRGSKILVTIEALEFGASPAAIGILAALYAAFPLLVAVFAGKISDRVGYGRPIAWGAVGMALALIVPTVVPGMPALFACTTLLGLAHIFHHVGMHNAVGAFGGGNDRTKNFGTYALGQSIAAFIGPSLAGFSIDHAGHQTTFIALAIVSLLPALLVAVRAIKMPQHVPQREETANGNALDLLRMPAMRRTLIMGGATLTAIELFSFYFPVYGRAIGLSASWIGIIMSINAAAGFVVRLVMHRLALRYTEVVLLTASLFFAGACYILLPMATDIVLLSVLSFVLGFGLGSAQPLTIIITYNQAPKGRSGEALGLRLTVNKITQIGVPLVFGSMSSALGVLPVFWAAAAFLIGGGLISTVSRKRPT
jgi:predicted MFS family arabinose efflux permease